MTTVALEASRQEAGQALKMPWVRSVRGWKEPKTPKRKLGSERCLWIGGMATWIKERYERLVVDSGCGAYENFPTEIHFVTGFLSQQLTKIRSDTTSPYDLFSNTDATAWDAVRQLAKVKAAGGSALGYVSETTRDRFQKLQEQNVKQGFGVMSYLSNEQRPYDDSDRQGKSTKNKHRGSKREKEKDNTPDGGKRRNKKDRKR